MDTQIETRLNELEKQIYITSKLEKANTSQLETISAQNTANIETNTNNIADNTTNIATNTTNIATLQGAVTENTTAIATLETNTATNTTNITTNSSAIANHETRITTLEKPEYYGSSNKEINALELKIFKEETYTHSGGNAKVSIGTKGANGPYGTVYTRINPMLNNHFVGTIKLYMSSIPSGQLSTSLNLIINGTTTALTPTFIDGEDYNLLLSFDFYASNVSNVFKVEFTDSLLVGTILEYIEITATSGDNFAVLNRDNSFRMGCFLRRTDERKIYWYSMQQGTYARYAFFEAIGGYNQSFSYFTNSYFFRSYTVEDGDHLSSSLYNLAVFRDASTNIYYYTPNSGMECKLVNETNTLKTLRTGYNYYRTLKTNVHHFDYSFHNGSLNTQFVLCGTTFSQELFLCNAEFNNTTFDIKLNNNYFPSSFVQLNAIRDYWIARRTALLTVGYIALHNTGTIIYIPSASSTYYIVIGNGTQPNAYLQENLTTINVYYTYNGKVIKKQLTYNSTTQKWELSDNIEIFATATEIMEMEYDTTLQKMILVSKLNGALQLID